METKCRYSLILFSTMLLVSCQGLKNITITGADGFQVTGMENNKVSFTADIGVSNPSGVGFRVKEVNLKAVIDGNFIGTVTSPDRVKIKARSDSSYHMNFSLELANMISGASTLYNLSKKKQVNVEMQGYVKARAGLGVKKVDVHESRLIDVPKRFR